MLCAGDGCSARGVAGCLEAALLLRVALLVLLSTAAAAAAAPGRCCWAAADAGPGAACICSPCKPPDTTPLLDLEPCSSKQHLLSTHLALLALLAITPDILQLLAASIDADGQAPSSLQKQSHSLHRRLLFPCCLTGKQRDCCQIGSHETELPASVHHKSDACIYFWAFLLRNCRSRRPGSSKASS